MGFRANVPGTEATRELDLLASLTEHAPFVPSGHDQPLHNIRVTLRAVVEAKAFEPGAAFVGFPFARPTEHELGVQRSRFGGWPAVATLPTFEEGVGLAVEPGGFAEAMAPLNEGHVCVQWAIARRGKKEGDPPGAQHEDAFWKGMDVVVRAAHARMASACHFIASRGSTHAPLLVAELPVLVVATPSLWVFDVNADTLVPVDHIMLSRYFEVAGENVPALVDVVTEHGVPALIDRYRRAMTNLKATTTTNARLIQVAADLQRNRLSNYGQMESYEALLERLSGR